MRTELQVNVFTTGSQHAAHLAGGGAGAVVIAWSSGPDGSGAGVCARRFGPVPNTPTATPTRPTMTPTTTQTYTLTPTRTVTPTPTGPAPCGDAPRAGCKSGRTGRGVLLLKKKATDESASRLVWKWNRGALDCL